MSILFDSLEVSDFFQTSSKWVDPSIFIRMIHTAFGHKHLGSNDELFTRENQVISVCAGLDEAVLARSCPMYGVLQLQWLIW